MPAARRLPAPLVALAFAVAYAVAVRGARATRLPDSEVSLVWPGAAVAVVWGLYAVTQPRGYAVLNWTLFGVVTFGMNLATGAPLVLASCFVVVNLVLVGLTMVVLALDGRPVRLESPADLGRLVIAIGVGSVCSALLAALSFQLVGEDAFVRTFLLFFVRNGVTALSGTAVLLRLRVVDWRMLSISPGRLAESIAIGGFAATVLAVSLWFNNGLPLVFLVYLPAVLVALRCTTTVSTLFLTLAGVLVISATVADKALLVDGDPALRALLAQAMVGSLTIVVLSLALFRDSRDRLIEELETTRQRAVSDSELLAAVLDGASEQSIIGTDEHGLITVFNRGAERMLGWTSEEMLGRTVAVVHVEEEIRARAVELGIPVGFDVFVDQVHPGEAEVREWTYVRRDGSRLTVSLAVSVMNAPSGEHSGYIGVATDITARKRAEAELQRLALHDALTGLANRAMLMQELEGALSRPLGVVYLDLDGFKQVNDGWGHVTGDRVLVEVGERVRRVVRPIDTVARIGGDEFAVLCPGVSDLAVLEELAERIRVELRRPYPLAPGVFFDQISASLGVALSNGDGDAASVLERADQLMYEAKRLGKDRYCAPQTA